MAKYLSLRIFVTILFTGLSCILIQAQTQFTAYDDIPGVIKSYKPAYSDSFPEWAKMLYNTPINVDEIEKGFQNYMSAHPGEKSPVIRYYKIWRRAVESYILEDGSIQVPDLKEYQQNLLSAQKDAVRNFKTGSGDNSNWAFLGPRQTFWLNESGSQQAPLSCPWQVNVYSFDVSVSNNSIIYVGTETGFVNKSIDNGLTWQLCGQGYPFGGAATAVAIHPGNSDLVYVSAGNQIHKTIDGGQNWTPMLVTSNLFGADRLIIDQSQPDKLVAAAGTGVYLSSDGGTSWTKKWTKASYDVEIKPDDPNVIYALAKNATGKFEVVISKDAGATFEVEATFPSGIAESSGGLLAVTPADPRLLFVVMLSANNTPYLYKGTVSSGIWTWTLLGTGQTDNFPMNNGQGYFDLVLAVSPIDEDLIFAGTTTLFKSQNGGARFIAIGGYSGAFSIHPDIQDIKMLPSGKTWVSTDGGMTITDDNFTATSKYFARINGIVGSDMWGFDQGWNEDLIVGGRYHNGNTAIADFYHDKALRMGGAESPTGWVLQGRSRQVAFNDLGSGWILPKEATGEPEGRFFFSKYPNMEEYGGRRSNLVAHPNYYGIIFLGEGNSIWRSSDMGVSFERIYTFPDKVLYLQISYSQPDILYADVVNRGLYKSEDGGYTWIAKTSLTKSPYGTAYWKGKLFFAISPYSGNTIYACLQNGTWSADIGKIFKSTDGGVTWTNWTGTVSETTKCLVIQPTQSGKDLVYLFTNSNNGKPAKVYFRIDGDADWTQYGNNYPASMHVNLALPFFRDSKLRVAGTGSVWESSLQEPAFTPIVTPWVERAHFNCMLDTLHFDDHSMLNHQGVTWNWSISPAPAFISDPNIRNPKVVLGTPGSYSVTLTITKDGQTYSRILPGMVDATTCPSVGDCTNPAEVSKTGWLSNVDSQEPGAAGSMAIDGDPNTIWHTRWSSNPNSYPHEFQVDMGSRYSVHKFIYLPWASGENGRIKKYELYISDDYEDYGLPVATGEWENTSAPQTVTLKNTKSGRYWRLVALSEVNGNIWASAAEFSIVGCNGNTSGSEIPALDNRVNAYPVPTNGLVRLDVPADTEYTYTILSALGKLIGHGQIRQESAGQTINLSNYESGVYLIRLIDKSGVCYWVKVVKN
ncbi:MAG: discoidin domain-containing protein [Bacteroidia bacterium]|nr:discoidin domain-containing protein [Bacteroidia bacterium]